MKTRAFKKALANDVCNVIDWLMGFCENELTSENVETIEKLKSELREALVPKLRPMSEMTEWEQQKYGELNSECAYRADEGSYAAFIDFLIERGLDYRGELEKEESEG